MSKLEQMVVTGLPVFLFNQRTYFGDVACTLLSFGQNEKNNATTQLIILKN